VIDKNQYGEYHWKQLLKELIGPNLIKYLHEIVTTAQNSTATVPNPVAAPAQALNEEMASIGRKIS
jgi:hypothetical protein